MPLPALWLSLQVDVSDVLAEFVDISDTVIDLFINHLQHEGILAPTNTPDLYLVVKSVQNRGNREVRCKDCFSEECCVLNRALLAGCVHQWSSNVCCRTASCLQQWFICWFVYDFHKSTCT